MCPIAEILGAITELLLLLCPVLVGVTPGIFNQVSYHLHITEVGIRVAKCQGYWGYIHVKMFAGWGKKFGRTCNFAKSSLFGKIYASFSSFPCTN